MSEANLLNRVLGCLRGMPLVYRGARSLYRFGTAIPLEVLRVAAPVNSRVGPPKGWFSALERLDAGELEGRVLFRSQQVPTAGLDSMRIVCGLKQDKYQPWPAFWTRHRNARLVGQSLVILDEQKRACIEAMYGPMRGFERNPAWRYLALERPTRLEGPWTSLVSFLGRHFYHWIYDELPRLAYLPDFPPETRILIPPNPAPYIWETIEMLGLKDRVRPTPEQHLLIDDFYFGAPSAMLGCPNPAALHFLRENFLGHADRNYSGPRSVYLIRSNKTRGIANATEVDAFFTERGWGTVDPERLTFAQQIQLFSQADAIAGLHGGSFINIAWCKPGTQVIELFSENFLNGCYDGIAACLNLKHRYAVFSGDGQHRAQIDVQKLEALLSE